MNAASPRVRARNRKKRCYELSFLGWLAAPEWTVVHGTVVHPLGPQDFRYGHAWLEHDGQVYDAVEDKFYSAEMYYRERCARGVRRFTVQELAEHVEAKGTFGPWD